MSRHDTTGQDTTRHDATVDEITNEEKTKLEERIKELERENLDLKIMNRGKDFFVDELKKEREYFEVVRREMTQQLIDKSEHVGQLQVQLRQLEAPRQEKTKPAEQQSNVIDVTPENTNREEIEEDASSVMF